MAVARPVPPALSLPPDTRALGCVELRSSLEAAADARGAVREVLHGLAEEIVDAACLLADELVGDALRRAGAPVRLVIDLDPHRIALEVLDSQPPQAASGAVASTEAEADGPAGRIVQALADDWGVVHQPTGSSVWCTLRLTPAP